ncbi:hypothetical protein U1Q18_032724 [Sarracenia purpurea var. burkii]
MVSTATDLEEEVIQVKKENAPFGSSRMTALVARIKRLKGISPIRINEFATELNWSTIITQATPAETKGFPELTVEGPASFVNDNKVNSDPTSCEFDPGDIGPVSLEVEPVLAVTGVNDGKRAKEFRGSVTVIDHPSSSRDLKGLKFKMEPMESDSAKVKGEKLENEQNLGDAIGGDEVGDCSFEAVTAIPLAEVLGRWVLGGFDGAEDSWKFLPPKLFGREKKLAA